jgi:hypothetical protein
LGQSLLVIVDELRFLEDKHRHCNTILLAKNEADHQSRRFYNPMWGLFGHRSPGAAGSFYWKSSAPHNPHWVIVDQVLVRASMVLTLMGLEILVSDGTHSLTKKDGTPDWSYESDHLPVVAKFDL